MWFVNRVSVLEFTLIPFFFFSNENEKMNLCDKAATLYINSLVREGLISVATYHLLLSS